MNILCFGLDNSILKPDSKLAARAREYGQLVGRYIAIVPNKTDQEIQLSANVKAIGISGNKTAALKKIYSKAQEIIQQEKISVISVQDAYYLGLIGQKLAKKNKIGLEIQVHGFEKMNFIRKRIARKNLTAADSIRTVSQRFKNKLINEFGVKPEKITVIPIFNELRITLPALPTGQAGGRQENEELKIKKENKNFVFLTVGRLVSVKNISLQIKALANILKNHPNCELWIVGEGDEGEKLKKLCHKLSIARYVKFNGWQDDLEKYYNQADAFLLTSNSEGWGLVIIEAAAYGLPIIMTDVGCAGEVIINNESGLVIPVGSQKELEAAMEKLIKDKNLREILGRNAKEAIKKLPTKEETLNLYLESWKKAVK